MLEKGIYWLNNNQGIVTVLVFVFGIVGYLIKHFLLGDQSSRKNSMQKQKGGDNSINIQAGRDINAHK